MGNFRCLQSGTKAGQVLPNFEDVPFIFLESNHGSDIIMYIVMRNYKMIYTMWHDQRDTLV